MRVDTRPRKRNSPRIAEKDAPAFKQWVRGRACLLKARGGCGGKIEAAHVDYAGDKGMGTKASDRFTVPLCTRHHAEQHRIGWASFDINEIGKAGAALEVANFLWERWPGRAAWERKLSDG